MEETLNKNIPNVDFKIDMEPVFTCIRYSSDDSSVATDNSQNFTNYIQSNYSIGEYDTIMITNGQTPNAL